MRKQQLLMEAQNQRLKGLAATTKRSEGELVREAVDDLLAKQTVEEQDWKAALRELRGMWKERDDLDHFHAERRERRHQRRERMMRLGFISRLDP